MLRFIVKIKTGDTYLNVQDESLKTIDINVPELEQLLSEGGSGECGYNIKNLVGVEVLKEGK